MKWNRSCALPKSGLFLKRLIFSDEADTLPAIDNLPAKRSPSQDSTNGPTVLGVPAKSLEGMEICIGDCPLKPFSTGKGGVSDVTGPNYPSIRIQADIGRRLISET